VTLLEMAFAGRCGLNIDLAPGDALAQLFAEELGAVCQIRSSDLDAVSEVLGDLPHRVIARVRSDEDIVIRQAEKDLFRSSRGALQSQWSEVSFRMQKLRDNPVCADKEFAAITASDPGFSARLTFDPGAFESGASKEVFSIGSGRPDIAILREQGVNGQIEMAAAFERAGFAPVDVHMSDLIAGRVALRDFPVLAACGGFSYGDVLGGGGGWAKSILFHEAIQEAFTDYFEADRLVLGVCNGCQMLANLKSLIPQAEHWPRFVRNASEQFEGRTVLSKVNESASPWLEGMAGSVMPVAVAHGEGRAEFDDERARAAFWASGGSVLQYVDNHHEVTEHYPANPNGAEQGLAGITAAEGRVLAMMPHPERVFRAWQNAWRDSTWKEDGPWMRLFYNARRAIG
jgi:phosphoribosylformylglycinamidine synthase